MDDKEPWPEGSVFRATEELREAFLEFWNALVECYRPYFLWLAKVLSGSKN